MSEPVNSWSDVAQILEALSANSGGAEIRITIRLPQPVKPVAPWQAAAHDIARRLRATGMPLEKLAKAVHLEMAARSSEPGLTGRGGRTPSAATILRHVLS